MISTKTIGAGGRSLIRDRLSRVLSGLRGRRGLWLLAGLAIIVGLALNWGWLVAVGIAPLLIAALPCVAMCALGLCMMGRNVTLPKNDAAKAGDASSEAGRSQTADTVELGSRSAVRAIEPTVLSAETTSATEDEPQQPEERKSPMRRPAKQITAVSALIVALATAPSVFAQEQPGTGSSGSGNAPMQGGMMGQGGMMQGNMMGQMSQMMEGCNKMMQSMNDRRGSRGQGNQPEQPAQPEKKG